MKQNLIFFLEQPEDGAPGWQLELLSYHIRETKGD